MSFVGIPQFYKGKEGENCLQDNLKSYDKVTQRISLLTVNSKNKLVNRAQMQQSKVYSRSTFLNISAKFSEKSCIRHMEIKM